MLKPKPIFPAEFADLEPYADYALPTQNERYAKRMNTSFSELKKAHTQLFDRLPQMLDYLDALGAPDEFEGADKTLMDLVLMVGATGVAVERLGAKSIENNMDLLRFKPAGF